MAHHEDNGTGKPIWITPAGDLGTIQEGEFYQLTLSAYEEGTTPPSSEHLYYTLIAGELPEGIQCRATGIIEGVPLAVSSIQGVPIEVGEDVTSKFTVRVYSEDENDNVYRVADRTFELTVSGQDAPQWITPAGPLGVFIDSDRIDLQLEYTDPDPGQIVETNLIAGQIPPETTLNKTGLISGVLTPVSRLPGDAEAGYDVTPFDVFGFDISNKSSSQNYQFTAEVTDGRDSDIRTWTMFVYSRDDLTADNGIITADSGHITSDLSNRRTPYITTTETDLGTVRHDNFYAFKIDAVDPDGDPFKYALEDIDDSSDGLPPGLELDENTGWIYGYIPSQGLTETDYQFGVQVYKTNAPEFISPVTHFTIKIVGNIDTDIEWITPYLVGTLSNGETSYLYVEAVASSGAPLEYQLKPGSDSTLPPGLALQRSGAITGTVSFQGFSLDGGTTTFDEELGTRLDASPTVFDSTYYFTVEAFNAGAQISTFKDFMIIINQKYSRPYETVYIKALPELEDRDLLSEMLDNQDIFNPAWIYRADDPNFGKASEVVYQHAFGVYAQSLDEYVTAMQLNHHRRNLTLGAIKTAQAVDLDGNVIYEVVYSEITDDLTNSKGESVSLEVPLDTPAEINGNTYNEVYPGSLFNMKTRLINQMGQYAEILPEWMKSKQENGSVLGFTPAWVIAYTVPGKAKQIAYNLSEQFTGKLNTIDFTIDRYVIDRRASQYWDFEEEAWIPGAETTFDRLDISDDYVFNSQVDFATEQAFANIDGETLTDLVALGGIDGRTTVDELDGKTLVFAKQEDFDGLTDDEAFTDRNNQILPGQDEDQADSFVNNDRMSIWTIAIDPDTELITLSKTKDTDENDYIKVMEGVKYGSNFLFYPEYDGSTVVSWQYVEADSTTQTIFDGGSTRFISNVDTYVSDDRYDKYVRYPKHNIIGNEDYITNGQ